MKDPVSGTEYSEEVIKKALETNNIGSINALTEQIKKGRVVLLGDVYKRQI